MSDPTKPVPGTMHIDASAVTLVAVADEEVPRMLKLRDGSEGAMNNIMLLKPEQIAKAGLHPDDIARLRSHIEQHREVKMFVDASRRMTDRLEQTLQHHGHEIAALFGEIASQGRRRARVSPHRNAILDALAALLTYQTAPAKKAVATRGKNKGQQDQTRKGTADAPIAALPAATVDAPAAPMG